MPKKKSVKRAAQRFCKQVGEIQSFTKKVTASASEEHKSWIHDHAIIRLYRSFEHLMLQALVGAINNDTGTISKRTGIDFPMHLTDEVCEYLIVSDGYFDFKGRSGLIKQLKSYVPEDHYLVTIVKKTKYKVHLDRMVALRNFASHASAQSKKRALDSLGQKRLRSSGSWLKKKDRFGKLCTNLTTLATEIERQAPY